MATKTDKKITWPTPRTVALPAGQKPTGGIKYRVKGPDGKVHSFNSQVLAEAFINSILTLNPKYHTIPGWDNTPQTTVRLTTAKHPRVVQKQPKQETPATEEQPTESTPMYSGSGRTGIDMYIGAAKPSPEFQRAYSRIGMNPIFNDVRVENAARAWATNPQAMLNWTDGGNAAAAFFTAPFAAATASEWAPWAGRALLNGLKWRYTTPSGWILGAATELPQVAAAADANNPNGDNRSRLERVWDYAWDNPGKMFMTLAGLQATYNWANNKWGTAPEWKYGEAAPGSKGLVPYDANYANKVKSLPRTVANKTKGFVKLNWLAVPAAIYGAWLFGDWLLSNPDEDNKPKPQEDNKNEAKKDTSNSSTQLPAGFRPVKGVNEATGEIIVPSSSGALDSTITIEPVTRNRFGRGSNLD